MVGEAIANASGNFGNIQKNKLPNEGKPLDQDGHASNPRHLIRDEERTNASEKYRNAVRQSDASNTSEHSKSPAVIRIISTAIMVPAIIGILSYMSTDANSVLTPVFFGMCCLYPCVMGSAGGKGRDTTGVRGRYNLIPLKTPHSQLEYKQQLKNIDSAYEQKKQECYHTYRTERSESTEQVPVYRTVPPWELGQDMYSQSHNRVVDHYDTVRVVSPASTNVAVDHKRLKDLEASQHRQRKELKEAWQEEKSREKKLKAMQRKQ
jgi:hypothetical protein